METRDLTRSSGLRDAVTCTQADAHFCSHLVPSVVSNWDQFCLDSITGGTHTLSGGRDQSKK